MSRITLFSQAPEVSIILGAYYKFFSKQANPNEERSEPEFDRLFANECIFCAPSQTGERPTIEDYRKFERLVAEWRDQRGALSWVTEMAMCPAYQSVIGMGPAAIPLILARLESEGDEPDHWFWALRALTGANPVTVEDRGDIVKMARAWIEWGRNSGYAR